MKYSYEQKTHAHSPQWAHKQLQLVDTDCAALNQTSLPFCIVVVWTVKGFSSGRFAFIDSHLENTSAPHRPTRASGSALRNGGDRSTALPPPLPPPSGCHGDRSVLVNDRVHVEENSRCRVSECAQAVSLCSSLRVFFHATSSSTIRFRQYGRAGRVVTHLLQGLHHYTVSHQRMVF